MGKKPPRGLSVLPSQDRMVSFQCEGDTLDRAVRHAKATDRALSAVLRIALREYLDREGA